MCEPYHSINVGYNQPAVVTDVGKYSENILDGLHQSADWTEVDRPPDPKTGSSIGVPDFVVFSRFGMGHSESQRAYESICGGVGVPLVQFETNWGIRDTKIDSGKNAVSESDLDLAHLVADRHAFKHSIGSIRTWQDFIRRSLINPQNKVHQGGILPGRFSSYARFMHDFMLTPEGKLVFEEELKQKFPGVDLGNCHEFDGTAWGELDEGRAIVDFLIGFPLESSKHVAKNKPALRQSYDDVEATAELPAPKEYDHRRLLVPEWADDDDAWKGDSNRLDKIMV